MEYLLILLQKITQLICVRKIEFDSIKSIGISTAGFIEGYYASKGKKVVATTLDNDGIEYMKSILNNINGYNNIEYR